MKKPETVVKFENNFLELETYIWLCDTSDIIRETEKALLVTIGYTRAHASIEAYIPKSTIILKRDEDTNIAHIYVPLSIAKGKGVGWHISNSNTTLPNGYIRYCNHNSNDDCNSCSNSSCNSCSNNSCCSGNKCANENSCNNGCNENPDDCCNWEYWSDGEFYNG